MEEPGYWIRRGVRGRVTRRRFMTGMALATGGITAAAFTLPALGFAIAPVFEQMPDTWQEIGPVSHFSDTDYQPEVITTQPGIGEAGLSLAYVRLHNRDVDGPVKDRYDHVIAISSRCVHVGCPVRYVAWREETGTVETAYRNWLRAERQERDLAFAAYCAALDREEYAAAEYERLITAATT